MDYEYLFFSQTRSIYYASDYKYINYVYDYKYDYKYIQIQNYDYKYINYVTIFNKIR